MLTRPDVSSQEKRVIPSIREVLIPSWRLEQHYPIVGIMVQVPISVKSIEIPRAYRVKPKIPHQTHSPWASPLYINARTLLVSGISLDICMHELLFFEEIKIRTEYGTYMRFTERRKFIRSSFNPFHKIT